jgi:putative membrane protein
VPAVPGGTRELWALLLMVGTALFISGLQPLDRSTWFMEVAPVILGVPILLATFRRFRLTPLLYRLLFFHALILIVGGHYTYAKVPAGFWLQDLLDLSRNHYDRLGHLAQGFVPAILARELLVRTSELRPGRWLFFLCLSVSLAFSAFYELIEWWAAVLLGESADAFLGTQGDPWDSQWDMCLALCGAVLSLTLLGRIHDRALNSLT